MDSLDLTKLTFLAEALADAASAKPSRVHEVLESAKPEASWRAELGLPAPGGELAHAIRSTHEALKRVQGQDAEVSFEELMKAANQLKDGSELAEKLAGQALIWAGEGRRLTQRRLDTWTVEDEQTIAKL